MQRPFLFTVSIVLIILPFLGIPFSWKMALSLFSGVLLLFFACQVPVSKREKPEQQKIV